MFFRRNRRNAQEGTSLPARTERKAAGYLVALALLVVVLMAFSPAYASVSSGVFSAKSSASSTKLSAQAPWSIPSAPHAHFMPIRPANSKAITYNTTGCNSGYTPPCSLASGGGPVMHNPQVVIVFWLPSGYSFDSTDTSTISASDAMFEQVMKGFFINSTGSGWMSIAQQYTDSSGAPGTTVTLLKSVVMTNAFPCGTCNSVTSPLSDANVQSEVSSVQSTYGTPTGSNTEYFVFTPLNIIQCFNSPGQSGGCSANAPSGYAAYCAYHNSFTSGANTFIYAEMPDVGTLLTSCSTYVDTTYPYGANGDQYADWEMNVASHEFMESITDPEPSTGWTDSGNGGAEIGDLCAWVFPPAPGYDDMANILQDVRPFYIQPEWSNSANACVLPTEPAKAVPSFTTSFAPTVAAGGTENIFVNATDSAAPAGWANVSVEFPSNPSLASLSVVSSTFPVTPTVLGTGSVVAGCYSLCSLSAGYPIVEAHANAWAAGTTYSMQLAFTPPANGNYTFYVHDVSAVPGSAFANAWTPHSNTVVDQLNENVTSYTFTVGSGSSPLAATLTATPSSIALGSTTTIATSASGGSGTYTYSYTGLPTGCTTANQVSLSCTPTAQGNYTVTVNVTDTAAHSTTATTTITVGPAGVTGPTISSFIVSPNPVTLGSTAVYTVTASGGTAPLAYAYAGLPTGCTTANSATLNCTPTAAGNFSTTVTVTDANSKSATSTTTLSVTQPPGPVVTAFLASPAIITLGSTSYLNATVTGGTAPYTYNYVGLPTGCSSQNLANLVCTPTVSGAFTVTVTVTDSKSLTASQSTTLTVNQPPALLISSFSASPASIQLGQSTTLSVSASGGTQPYTYNYTGLPSGCTSQDLASFACTPAGIGNFTVTVSITDPAGQLATQTTTVAVTNAPGSPVISSFTASPSSVVLGASVSFSVFASGGTAPYTYAYTGLPAGCVSTNAASFSCVPTAAGNYTVVAKVTDSKSLWTSAAATISVTSASGGILISSFGVSPSTAYLNSQVTFSVSATGGTAPYSYSYTGLPSGCLSSNRATLACSPAQSGRFTVSVYVSDTAGGRAASSTTLTVDSYSQLAASATPSVNPVAAGSTTVITVSASGGQSPYSYSYTGLPQGCTSSNTNSLSCTPSQAGNFTVIIVVSDSSGQSKTLSMALSVTAASSNNSGTILGLPSTIFLLLLVVLIVAIVVVAVVIRRGRTRPPQPPPQVQSWAPPSPGYPAQPGWQQGPPPPPPQG